MSQSTRSRGVRSSTPTRSVAPESTTTESRAASPTTVTDSLLYSRLEEKKNLQQLNDRLAHYIGTVRSLQNENQTLIKRIQCSEEATAKEVSTVKSLYENELLEVRRQNSTLSTAKASLQIDLQRLSSEKDELAARFAQSEKDSNKLRTRCDQLESDLRKVKTELSESVDTVKKLESERNTLSRELTDLKKGHAAIQDQLRKETLTRIDLETKLKEHIEKLAFNDHTHREQLNQSRASRTEIEEQVTREAEALYSQKLGEELSELRAESDEKLRASRAELEAQYEVRITDLQQKIKSRVANENKLRSEVQTLQSKLSSVESSLKELESANRGQKERIVDLEKILDQERSWHTNELKEKENELATLTQQIQDHLKQYKDLYDVKVALDLEIDTYRKLVEAEELRCNSSLGDVSSISSASASTSFSSPLRSAKRKRHISEETHYLTEYLTDSEKSGDVEIIDHDADGKYVRIENKNDKDISLSNWQVIRKAGDETVTYKFHRNLVLKANSAITIWSHNVENVAHNPPADLIMKTQIWPAAAEMSTLLYDNTGKEVASRITKPRTYKRRLTDVRAGAEHEKSCCIQ